MNNLHDNSLGLTEEQQSIRAKCYHPTGNFIPFSKKDINQSIPERFEKQVQLHPNRLALKTKTKQLTYRGLNKAANRVAHALSYSYSRPQKPVLIITKSDEKIVIATLGVLKAGHICIPLTAQPLRHLESQIKGSRAKLIITDTDYLPTVREQNYIKNILNIDEIDCDIPCHNPDVAIDPVWLSHILYTSGSTGQVKGAIHSHQTILHIVRDNTNSLGISCDDHIASFAANGFIGSVATMLRTLLNGAALYPLDIKNESMAALVDLFVQEDITLAQFVPSLYRSFVNDVSQKVTLNKLRVIQLAGESITQQDVALFKQTFLPKTILLNEIGATEAGAFRRLYIDHDTQIPEDKIPVGYPIEDKEVLLLVPAGQEVGEIVVRSPYLAQGYWYESALTQKFFSFAFDYQENSLFFTGDLGHMRPNGCLEYIGRKDLRVKIRGFQIEIEEIESALNSLTMIKHGVVVLRRNQCNDKLLVAYIVPQEQTVPRVADLRKALIGRLPDYMIPSSYITIKDLPLTPNGKIDRKALTEPKNVRQIINTSFIPAQTPIEQTIADIWSEVFAIDRVGMTDDFFALGGDSIKAMQILSRLRGELRIDISIKMLFENTLLKDLARRIERGLSNHKI